MVVLTVAFTSVPTHLSLWIDKWIMGESIKNTDPNVGSTSAAHRVGPSTSVRLLTYSAPSGQGQYELLLSPMEPSTSTVPEELQSTTTISEMEKLFLSLQLMILWKLLKWSLRREVISYFHSVTQDIGNYHSCRVGWLAKAMLAKEWDDLLIVVPMKIHLHLVRSKMLLWWFPQLCHLGLANQGLPVDRFTAPFFTCSHDTSDWI